MWIIRDKVVFSMELSECAPTVSGLQNWIMEGLRDNRDELCGPKEQVVALKSRRTLQIAILAHYNGQ
jgi:hypothetical protein